MHAAYIQTCMTIHFVLFYMHMWSLTRSTTAVTMNVRALHVFILPLQPVLSLQVVAPHWARTPSKCLERGSP